ncbi:MAG: hypothetical protein PHS33_08500 [Candidatus Omnitrophica bacterium]|nr:hypothetical protein [Candidatus Omnitrophota bacterium]
MSTNTNKDDYFDLGAIIKEPTEFKDPGTHRQAQREFIRFEPNKNAGSSPIDPPGENKDNYFHDDILGQEQKPKKEPEKVKLDPDLTADITVSTIDSLQNVAFFTAYQRKYKQKIFSSYEEYKDSQDLTYVPREEQKNLGEHEKKLLAKIEDFNNRLKKITPRLPLTTEEKLKLKGPLKSIIQTYDFDLPPGLALIIVGGEIMINRMLEFKME